MTIQLSDNDMELLEDSISFGRIDEDKLMQENIDAWRTHNHKLGKIWNVLCKNTWGKFDK